MKGYNEFLNERGDSMKGDQMSRKRQQEGWWETGVINNFKGRSGYEKKDDKYYDYSNGAVYHSHTIVENNEEFNWLPAKKVKIMNELGLTLPHLKAYFKFTEYISDEKNSRPTEIAIGVPGRNNINYYKRLVLDDKNFDYKKIANGKKVSAWFKKSIKEIQKEASGEFRPDLIDSILWNLKAGKSDYKTTGSTDIGIGSHASTHIHKNYEKVFEIKNLDKLFGMSQEKTEEQIKKHWRFKKDKLGFDWKKGLMFVGGSYTEVWD